MGRPAPGSVVVHATALSASAGTRWSDSCSQPMFCHCCHSAYTVKETTVDFPFYAVGLFVFATVC